MSTLRHLDLFSGIGGFALAVRWLGHETVGFCEIDEWSRRVLDKHWPGVPKHDDIRTLKGTEFGPIDLVTGGFPCQPFSIAGQRRGEDDPRHLWPAMHRIIDTARPRFVLAENVAGIVNMALDGVLADLEAIGYTAGAVVIPAGAVNALHRRDRVWIMAHRNEPNGQTCSPNRMGTGEQADTPARPGSDTPLPNCNIEHAPERGQRSVATGEGAERRAHGSGSHGDDRQVTDGGTGQDTRHMAYAEGDIRGTSGDGGHVTPDRASNHAGSTERMAHRDGIGLEGAEPVGIGQRIEPWPRHASRGEAIAGVGIPDTERSGQPRPGECRHASDQAQDREGQAGDAVHASAANVGRETPRTVDAGPDGLPPELVRRSWADGTWELDLPRVVTHEPERRQKLQAAGNAIVPQVAYEILRVMLAESQP